MLCYRPSKLTPPAPRWRSGQGGPGQHCSLRPRSVAAQPQRLPVGQGLAVRPRRLFDFKLKFKRRTPTEAPPAHVSESESPRVPCAAQGQARARAAGVSLSCHHPRRQGSGAAGDGRGPSEWG